MTKREDLLAKARNNPKGLRFGELLNLAKAFGWAFVRQKGSHQVWVNKESQQHLTFQEGPSGKAMPYQVRLLLELIDD